MGGAPLHLVALVPHIQGQAKPLAFLDHQGIRIPFLRIVPDSGPLFGLTIGKQQMIGDVFVAVYPLLRQVIGPTQEVKNGPDQVLLG